jgi:hypothetical protein
MRQYPRDRISRWRSRGRAGRKNRGIDYFAARDSGACVGGEEFDRVSRGVGHAGEIFDHLIIDAKSKAIAKQVVQFFFVHGTCAFTPGGVLPRASITRWGIKIDWAKGAVRIHGVGNRMRTRGRSSVGRASASQAECREFEPPRPLFQLSLQGFISVSSSA